jgi:hypothetical protein
VKDILVARLRRSWDYSSLKPPPGQQARRSGTPRQTGQIDATAQPSQLTTAHEGLHLLRGLDLFRARDQPTSSPSIPGLVPPLAAATVAIRSLDGPPNRQTASSCPCLAADASRVTYLYPAPVHCFFLASVGPIHFFRPSFKT